MALDKFKASPLPNPPREWDSEYGRMLIRALETYFSQLDSNTPNHAEKYTSDTFTGGTFTGTNVVATNVATDTLEAELIFAGYERLNGIQADGVLAYGLKTGRMTSDDAMIGSVYANNFYGNGSNIWTPYTQLVGTTTQTLSAIDQAVAVTYDINDFPDGITFTSGSRITFAYSGVYQLIFSLQYESTSTGTEQINVWFRKNGTDIPVSNFELSIPARKSVGIPAALIATSPFLVPLAAGDYVEIMWSSTATTTILQNKDAVSFSAGVTPAIPATPAAFVAIAFISASFPLVTYVAPLPTFGFGRIGNVSVFTTKG